VPLVSSPAAAGAVGVATVTLTNAQIKALPTTPVQLVAAGAAGTTLVPLLVWMHLTWVADYTNISATSVVGVQYGTTSAVSGLAQMLEATGSQVSNLLADGASHSALLPPMSLVGTTFTVAPGQFDDDPNPVASALTLFATNTGDYTGGNAGNSLKVWTYYASVTL
jgi:hypothetical protein